MTVEWLCFITTNEGWMVVVGWVVDTPKRRQCNEGACGEDYKLPTYTQRVAELFYDAIQLPREEAFYEDPFCS